MEYIQLTECFQRMDEDFWSFIDGVLPSDVCDCMAEYGHDHQLVISQEVAGGGGSLCTDETDGRR